ncbi:hypothetical protein F25303_4289 [Fusarium sp. NRRL 25303]|nr:hypothetical protein F25303_4289 [Fusarium sp. NRRL 25303]
MKDPSDKQWAKAYILDPLNDIEPNQDTGIGASHNLAAQLRNISLEGPSSNANSTPTGPVLPREGTGTNQVIRVKDIAKAAILLRQRLPAQLATASIPRTHSPTLQLRVVNLQLHHFSASNCGVSRQRSLIQRYPGDMSHRPLDILRKEARAADRAPHLRRKQMPMTDTIDALDTIGGMYHHGGPYDATLASRNCNKMYSPVAAVEDSNREALRATPRENIQDALLKKMPLQGTADIPSGERDISGNTINYEEGADLMREPDAVGGAYKRWDGIQYHPDDLKGKGEPSYTYEKDLKEQKRFRRGEPVEYELSSNMRGSKRPPFSHNRSFSENPRTTPEFSNGTDIRRNNSTGKHRLSDGIRRRFGSMRRKKVEVE